MNFVNKFAKVSLTLWKRKKKPSEGISQNFWFRADDNGHFQLVPFFKWLKKIQQKNPQYPYPELKLVAVEDTSPENELIKSIKACSEYHYQRYINAVTDQEKRIVCKDLFKNGPRKGTPCSKPLSSNG